MPLAATHVLLAVIIADLLRDYFIHKKYFTNHTIFLAGIGGLLPDIDFPLNWFFQMLNIKTTLFNHGGITHTLFFGMIFFLIGFYFLKKDKHKISTYFFAISFGIILHIFLDFILGGGAYEGIMFFWPFSNESYKIHLLSKLNLSDIPAAIDAIILLAWLWHEEKKHKITDFF
ncbi:MAG: metal-dependent hydrolase [Candidatus Aenigmarchaeota archaeon]|nr:metal-dependent hydrolase [Candidatus Aenigmarchaeota archaeon]MBU5689237.1 metal-dependent hydrolase [Candidatus Aenigmarchaeota archaeon]